MRRVLVVATGIALGSVAAMVTVAIILAILLIERPDHGASILFALTGRALAAVVDDESRETITLAVYALWLNGVRLCALPVALVGLAAETWGGASFWVALLGTAGLTLAVPSIVAASGSVLPDPQIAPVFFLTGAVAGWVYWLVAGRSASPLAPRWPDRESAPTWQSRQDRL